MQIPTHIESFRKDLTLKNYSQNTIENYISQVKLFLWDHRELFAEPVKINETAIKEWLLKAKSINGRKHRLSALKLFYKFTIKQPMKFKYIEYPRKEEKLPQPLSMQEVERLFDAITNLKHKAITALLFGCGMRVSEVINLKPTNIDRSNMVIHIIGAKGKKDRIVPLDENILKLLEKYWKEYKPKEYLFNGQGSLQYSDRSINEFLKSYAAKAGIKKNLHSHLGRHSYATALYGSGTDLSIIQGILGHNSEMTSRIYAKISSARINKIKSPISSFICPTNN